MGNEKFFTRCLSESYNRDETAREERLLLEAIDLPKTLDAIASFAEKFPKELQLAVQTVNNMSQQERDMLLDMMAKKYGVSEKVLEGAFTDRVKEKIRASLDWLAIRFTKPGNPLFLGTTNPRMLLTATLLLISLASFSFEKVSNIDWHPAASQPLPLSDLEQVASKATWTRGVTDPSDIEKNMSALSSATGLGNTPGIKPGNALYGLYSHAKIQDMAKSIPVGTWESIQNWVYSHKGMYLEAIVGALYSVIKFLATPVIAVASFTGLRQLSQQYLVKRAAEEKQKS